jgi:hypothetical protein
MEPFDLGAPPAELPHGSTNLPSFTHGQDVVDQNWNRQPIPAQPLPNIDYEKPFGVYAEQLVQFAPEMQEAIRSWWPHIFGKTSVYTNKVVFSVAEVVEHINAANKEATHHRKADTDLHGSAVWIWQKECGLRKQWIESKKSEYQRRQAEAQKAIAAWDAYVAEAKLDYQNAKATPKPPRPVR